jgi:hypothetical protein
VSDTGIAVVLDATALAAYVDGQVAVGELIAGVTFTGVTSLVSEPVSVAVFAGLVAGLLAAEAECQRLDILVTRAITALEQPVDTITARMCTREHDHERITPAPSVPSLTGRWTRQRFRYAGYGSAVDRATGRDCTRFG